jgi:glycosyltransferase involved in cell wall biosynthesis
MKRPIYHDASYLIARLGCVAPDGFTNVDLAYARRLAKMPDARFLRLRRREPAVLDADNVRRVVASHDRAFAHPTARRAATFASVRAAVLGPPNAASRPHGGARPLLGLADLAAEWRADLQRARIRSSGSAGPIEEGAIYLSVAQYRLEHPREFDWLDRRRDIRPVFLLHDFLPLDHPEFFAAGYAAMFDRRMATALARARGLIVTSHAVRDRLAEEVARRGLAPVPVLVAPLPSPVAVSPEAGLDDPDLARAPYFVMVAAIEPRKNHLFLLSVWRLMAEAAEARGEPVPRLVLVGRRGRESEQVIDMIERSHFASRHVIEAPGLCYEDLARLVANARAALVPSFAEGYGLPIVEALALGTPVLASDIPVFHEVSRGCALFRNPVDGLGWTEAIRDLTDRTSATSRRAKEMAARFEPPSWDGYFDDVLAFLREI